MKEEVEKFIKEAKRRREESSKLYHNFEKIREEDSEKAGEFLWGAVNNLIYAMGLSYGKKLGSHGKIKEFMRQICNEEIYESFIAAEDLHSNFYHSWMDEERFKMAVKEAVKVIMELDKMLKLRIESIR